jgi:hypothetical protein
VLELGGLAGMWNALRPDHIRPEKSLLSAQRRAVETTKHSPAGRRLQGWRGGVYKDVVTYAASPGAGACLPPTRAPGIGAIPQATGAHGGGTATIGMSSTEVCGSSRPRT